MMKKKTNIFSSISKCFNYLVYCSETEKTHTYYLNLVVMKRQKTKEGIDKWVKLHRLNEKLVGYYSTLKLFPSVNHNNKPICYFQSIQQVEIPFGQWCCQFMVTKWRCRSYSYIVQISCSLICRYTLLKMGYAILMPNFPGSAGYGKQYL